MSVVLKQMSVEALDNEILVDIDVEKSEEKTRRSTIESNAQRDVARLIPVQERLTVFEDESNFRLR